MYQQQVLAAQLAAHQLQQQQQNQASQERPEDKLTPHQPLDKQTPPHQPLFGQFRPPSSVTEVKRPETSTYLPDRPVQRTVESNQLNLNNPPQHSDPFKQHRTVADSVPKAHVLPMKSEPRVSEAVPVQPSADLTNKMKPEPVMPPPVLAAEKQPSPKPQQPVQQDPLKPYESVFLKREQQFQASQAQRQKLAQMPFVRPQGPQAPGVAPGAAPYQRVDNRSNIPPQQQTAAQQGSWKASFTRPLSQPPLAVGQKPGFPLKDSQEYKPPSWQDRFNKKPTDLPNAPISQQMLPQRPHSSGPPLPQRQPRQVKPITKDNKENKPAWYNPYSDSIQSKPDSGVSSQKTDTTGKPKTPVTLLKPDKKDADDQSGVRALKGRLPGSYPGDHPKPSGPMTSSAFGDKGKHLWLFVFSPL